MSTPHRYARGLLIVTFVTGLCAGLASPFLFVRAAPSPYAALEVVISEVAWAGTDASADDEWIELYSAAGVNFNSDPGWRLLADDGSPDIVLTGSIGADGWFLLERASENVTDQPADLIYFGALDDDGETMRLRAPDGTIIDTANVDGGAWPAGSASPNGSMERYGPIIEADSQFAWGTNQDGLSVGFDAANNPIHGTPGAANWTFSVTPTFTPNPTDTPPPAAPLTLLINEVAWMGTLASSTDEWIELYNPPGGGPINLLGWRLRAADGLPSISLSGTVPDGEYFLLATNDSLFVDDDPGTFDLLPDLVYDGSMANEGEVLRLYDPANAIVDTANSDSGAWPAGVASPRYASMERRGVTTDAFFAWVTYANPATTATPWPPPYPDPVIHDRSGNVVKGTPRQVNWGISVTQTPTFTASPTRTRTPTRTPTRRPTATPYLSRLVLINEYLPRPGHDWNNDGKVNVYDEFIEIINVDSVDVNLKDWKIDDGEDEGSPEFTLPSTALKPGQRAVFYASQSGILLSDGGDEVRLIRPNGQLADRQEYPFARSPDESRCRLPEQYLGEWHEACFPTPGTANALQGRIPSAPIARLPEPACLLPDTLPEDFLIGECEAFGSDIWNAWYWDRTGWAGGAYVPQNSSGWETFVE